MTETRSAYYDSVKQDAMISLEQAAWHHSQAVKALAAEEYGSSRAQALVASLLNAGDVLRQKLSLALTHGATVEEVCAVPELHPSYAEDVRTGVIQAKI